MEWDKEALDEISKVPFFIKKKVRKKVEEFASEKGCKIVDISHVKGAKEKFFNNMHREMKGYRVETCFGSAKCPNSIDIDKNLPEKITALLKSKNILAFLKKNTKGKIKFHQEFKVSISFCPNSCSRPQIADVGLIAASVPWINTENCNNCGACGKICVDNAVVFNKNSDFPMISSDLCMKCGQCIKACKKGGMISTKKGFRVLMGGKLGRHPRLGLELPGIYSPDETLRIIDKSVTLIMSQKNNAKRFSEIFNKENIHEFINI